MRRTLPQAFAAVFLFTSILALSGCGLRSVGTANSAGQSDPAAGTPPSTGTSVATGTPSAGTPSAGRGPQACPGGVGTISAAGTPQLVLGGNGGRTRGTSRAGELVQVQLPATIRWSFDGDEAQAGVLQPAGYEDMGQHVCVWNFRPMAPASLTLTFTGTALCTGKGACPQFVYRETFSVTVG